MLWASWLALVSVGARTQIGARFGARGGSLLMENLGAESLRFGGEGRNRPYLAFPIPLEINDLFHR